MTVVIPGPGVVKQPKIIQCQQSLHAEKEVTCTGGGLAGRGEILLDLNWEGVSKYAPCPYGLVRAPNC